MYKLWYNHFDIHRYYRFGNVKMMRKFKKSIYQDHCCNDQTLTQNTRHILVYPTAIFNKKDSGSPLSDFEKTIQKAVSKQCSFQAKESNSITY